MTAEVIRWTGGPGSGKTYQLLEDVRREVEDGRTLRDVALMSFSRAQAADLADRLQRSVFPDEPDTAIRRRCATIDAIALRACRSTGLVDPSPDTIIQPGAKKAIPVYQEFMQAAGIPYTPGAHLADDGDLISRANLPAGNQILEINAYLSATMRPPTDWRIAAAGLGLPIDGGAWNVPDLLPAWQDYKTRRGVFEHADYVRLALDERIRPPAPVLFVDEYQDVSPLQDALIRHWIDRCDRVYVAGDPDQSIYGYRGCGPDLFNNLPGAVDRGSHNGNRPVSRRCPAAVMETAEALLGHPANVEPAGRRGISARTVPRDIGGLVWQIEEAVRAYPDTVTPVYVLSRFQRHVSQIARQLSAAGIPCTGIRRPDGGPWGQARIGRHEKTLERATVKVWSLTCAIRRWTAGTEISPVPFEEAEALIATATPAARRAHAITALKSKARRAPLRIGDLSGWVPTVPGDRIIDILNLRPTITDQIRRCLANERRRGTVIEPQAVRVDTIHAAKGLEAPAVLLHTGYLSGLMGGLGDPDRMAEERRVFFVGATRASHAAILFDYIGPAWPGFGRPA